MPSWFCVPVSNLPGSGIRCRADLVGFQFVEQFIAPIERPGVRTEKFIRGTYQEIHAQRLHVDRTVRSVLHRVDVDQRAGGMGHFGDLSHRVDGPDRVRGVAESHDLWLAFQRFFEIVQLQGAVFHVEVDPGHLAAALRATSSQGEMLASWSRRVTTISSPGFEPVRERVG